MDRNPVVPAELTTLVKSLSARRAWIEISIAPGTSVFRGVALRKESVDRNVFLTLTVRNVPSRSPQGERG